MAENPAKQDEKQGLRLVESCSKCNKRISAKGSFTAWIFQEERCRCNSPEPRRHEVRVPDADSLLGAQLQPTPRPFFEPTSVASVEKLNTKYEILEVLGRGSMGSVYKVRDRELEKIFAVKVLNPELASDQHSVKRFEQEALSASQLTHVNLVAVYGCERLDDSTPYLIMDYLEGESLADLIRQDGALPPAKALEFMTQVAEGLAHAHMKGVVHRDLKPANLIVSTRKSGASVVRIVDFGIARVLPTEGRELTRLTQTGDFIGSPSYMSPEQCAGAEVGFRSDLYSLGCVFYELLTRKPPLEGASFAQTIVNQMTVAPPPIPAEFGVPEGMQAVISKLLEKNPEDRYQSADQLLQDLYRLRAGQKPHIKKRKKKKPVFAIAAVVSLMCMGASIMGMRAAIQENPTVGAQVLIGLKLPPFVESVLVSNELGQALQTYRVVEKLYAQNKFEQAEAMLKGLSATSPEYNAVVAYPYARVEAALGKPEMAESIVRALAGGQDLGTARNLHTLSVDVINWNKPSDAIQLCKRSLALYTKCKGPDSYEAAKVLYNIAVCEGRLGNIKGGLRTGRKSLAMFEKTGGPDKAQWTTWCKELIDGMTKDLAKD